MRTCLACGNEVAPEAPQCDVCTSKQPPGLCKVCGKAMPQAARRCNECQSYQSRWRRRLPFGSAALLVLSTIFTLVSGAWSGVVYVADSGSSTRIKVTGSDDVHIFLRVWNTGSKPSTLVGFRLLFDGRPGKEIPLILSGHDQQEAMNFVPGKSSVKVAVARAPDSAVPAEELKRKLGPDELEKLLTGEWAGKAMTIEGDVEESIDPWCPWNAFRSHHVRTDHFLAARISQFIQKSLGG